jgi:ABC-type multidrug transport system fused ATPase/permease subunit
MGIKVKTIYDNFNLEITPGSIVALIGPSGSGKSTLFNILTKLEEPEYGRVTIDGTDISDWTFKEVQKNISYVTQDVYLFKGTFRENLIYGNQHFNHDDDRLKECLSLTNALEFVEAKGGLDGTVNEKGNNLSGG